MMVAMMTAITMLMTVLPTRSQLPIEKAKAGDMDEQYRLAVSYHHGVHVDDIRKQLSRRTPFIQLTGRRIIRDWKKARQWYELAAMQGHGMAQFNIGVSVSAT